MQVDKLSLLNAKVESLQEIVNVLEASKADEIAKKWRAKLFEELVRNKKLMILHAQELRGLKDNELKHLAREEELQGVLDNLQRQLTSLTIEKQNSQSEAAKARQDLKRENETSCKLSELLAGVPQQISSNLDVLSKLHSAIDVFKQRVFIMNSRVTTTKLLLRNLHKAQYSEFSYELEQLRKETQKLDRVTTEALAAKAENERLQAENFELQRMMKQLTAESEAKLKDVSENLYGKNDALAREKADLQAELAKIKADWANLREEKLSLERKNTEQTEEIKRLQSEAKANFLAAQQVAADLDVRVRELNETVLTETQNKSDALELLQEFKAKAEELEQTLIQLQATSEESINEEARYWQEDIKAKERLIRELKRERDSLLANIETKPKTTNSSSQTESRTFTQMRTTTPSRRLETPASKIPILEELTKELLDTSF